MVLKLLEFKERVKKIYGKYGAYIRMVLKFLAAAAVFSIINAEAGYNGALKSPVITVGLSIISALTPDAVFALLVMAFTVAHVYSISPVLAVIIAITYLLIYLLYARFAPGQSYVMIAVPILCVLDIPYAAPLICGIFLGPVSMISNAIGIFIYNVFREIISAAGVSGGGSVSNTVNFFNVIVDNMKSNKYMFVSMAIFAMVVLVTYIIRRQKIKYAANIAILAGTLVNVVAFLIASAFIPDAATRVQILAGSAVSMVVAYIASFFKMSLDYSGTKNIQFEDDEYYYYVKAVPKLTVPAPDKQVKTIQEQAPTGNTANISEVFDVDYNLSKKD